MITEEVKLLVNIFNKEKFNIYLVGGCVRDMIMNKEPHDYDLTTNATPDQMIEIANKYNIKIIPTGIQYGTITFNIGDKYYEVTTFRSDGNYSDGRRPDQITFSNNIYQDLSRRDFTVNAIALNLFDNTYIDPFNGRKDIENHVIMTVGIPEERFREDGLRILRAIRFKFKLGFTMEENTYKAILNNWNLLDHVSQERITSEFLQILEYCNIDSQQDAMLMDGLIKYLLPEAWYKNDYDSNFWRYEAIRGFSDVECRLAYLLRESKSSAEVTCKRLKLSNEFTKDVCDTLRAFDYIIELDSTVDLEGVNKLDRDNHIARKLVSKYGTKNSLRALEIFADEYGLAPQDYYELYDIIEEVTNKYPTTLKELAVKGEDLLQLGYEGKEVGKLLNNMLERILDDPSLNEKEILLSLIYY